MQGIIVEVLVGMFLLMYFAFVVFTVYLTITTNNNARLDVIGKLLWYHGASWILVMIFSCAGSVIIVLSRFISKTLGL